MSIVIVLTAIMKLTPAIKPTAIVMQTTIIKSTVIVMPMTIIKAAAGMRTLTQRPKAATAGYIEALRQMTGSMCRFLRNLAAYRKNAAGTESHGGRKRTAQGFVASAVMIAAIAVLIVLIGLKAGAGMSGTIDKKETLPAMSTEEDLIPVEKYPVNGILTSNKHFGSRQKDKIMAQKSDFKTVETDLDELEEKIRKHRRK